MKRLTDTILAPIRFLIDSFQILAWETEHGGIDGTDGEGHEHR